MVFFHVFFLASLKEFLVHVPGYPIILKFSLNIFSEYLSDTAVTLVRYVFQARVSRLPVTLRVIGPNLSAITFRRQLFKKNHKKRGQDTLPRVQGDVGTKGRRVDGCCCAFLVYLCRSSSAPDGRWGACTTLCAYHSLSPAFEHSGVSGVWLVGLKEGQGKGRWGREGGREDAV